MDGHTNNFLLAKAVRDWAGLPWNILLEIFIRVGAVCLFASVQLVCREWQRVANEPRIWKRVCINHTNLLLYKGLVRTKIHFGTSNVEMLELAVVDRSKGRLEEFICESSIYLFPSPRRLLQRIAERCFHLKVLNLGHRFSADERDFIEACKYFPLLEVLDCVNTKFTEVGIESIGRSCPNLKHFGFRNNLLIQYSQYKFNNSLALAVTKHMRGLHILKIGEDMMDDDGLLAILNACSHLQLLIVRNCFHLKFGKNLENKLIEIKLKYYNVLDYDFDS
ncbi:hypothetical protein ZOSMA_326G00050 [Zostera marina]|uniref:F-box domain-containing protein n=1 Tax=Zostera marina TaxID=29655 RepID=A0A0K9PAX2_ZOSMR|nr:hypothetical protein ZOSMA_326G00050 [Zostera marina]